MCPFSTYIEMLTGLILYQPYAGNYTCDELVGITSLPCPEDIVLQQCSQTLTLTIPPSACSLSLAGRDVMQMSLCG